MTAKDLIVAFVKAGEASESAFRALALANFKMTINQIVLAILNHPQSDAPRWVKGEKGCGKKAGTAKSLKTIRTDNPADWRDKFKYAHMAQLFESNATHYKQTDGKKFVRRRNKDTGEFELVFKRELTQAQKDAAKKKREEESNATDSNAADGTRAVPVDTLQVDMQAFIDAIRADMTANIREQLLELTAKHNMEVKIPTVS